MFQTIARAIQRFFDPALELVAALPPQAVSRLTSPF
jgi:hypothetical protein